MIFKRIILSLIVIFISQSIFASTVTYNYRNQRGSTLVVNFDNLSSPTGPVYGTFTSAVGDCKPDVGVALPYTGFYNGNAVSFSVDFPHCKQVVGMTGNFSNDLSVIHIIWLSASPVDDPEGKNWNSNIVGTDVYTKIG